MRALGPGVLSAGLALAATAPVLGARSRLSAPRLEALQGAVREEGSGTPELTAAARLGHSTLIPPHTHTHDTMSNPADCFFGDSRFPEGLGGRL